MPQTELEQIISLLAKATDAVRDAVFTELRRGRHLHRLEKDWGATAEFILEAIARSQDITKRGVRGIIAELAFSEYVLRPLKPRWTECIISGDLPYDSLIEDENGKITIQTKNQRLKKGVPLYTNATMVRRIPDVQGWFVAETQKTRTGKFKKQGNDATNMKDAGAEELLQLTRPYRFGEFDILSVCLHPSSGEWSHFMFAPAKTLMASPKDARFMNTLQPVPANPGFAWTNDLQTCIAWVRNPESCPSPQAMVRAVTEPKSKAKRTKSKKTTRKKPRAKST